MSRYLKLYNENRINRQTRRFEVRTDKLKETTIKMETKSQRWLGTDLNYLMKRK